jgi:hypothetical protein
MLHTHTQKSDPRYMRSLAVFPAPTCCWQSVTARPVTLFTGSTEEHLCDDFGDDAEGRIDAIGSLVFGSSFATTTQLDLLLVRQHMAETL